MFLLHGSILALKDLVVTFHHFERLLPDIVLHHLSCWPLYRAFTQVSGLLLGPPCGQFVLSHDTGTVSYLWRSCQSACVLGDLGN